jgi:uncharacterized protein YdeI (YjbR/CyaY-like superfamily)
MTTRNDRVDAYLSKATQWRQEFRTLRAICLASGLTEELKWRLPCYTFQGNNVAIIQGFKEYCALMFFKGSLLKDPRHILVAPGASQAARQARFTDPGEIDRLEPVLKAFIREAVQLEKAGRQVQLKQTSDFKIPEEFQTQLDKNRALKTAFQALTPGRQRGYLFYFSQPKQSGTREARVAKSIPQILRGKGLND